MSDQGTADAWPPADSHRAVRAAGLAAVAAGVLLLAAAAFALSYAGIHAMALYAGVSPRLARLYPLIFDAMLVVAGAAVLSLRGAGLPSRCYAWLSLLALLVVAAGADVLYATGVRPPHKPTAAAAAIIPWALVLIGFGLLLCLLRQARLRRARAAAEEGLLEPSGQAEVVAGIDALFGPRESPAPEASLTPEAPQAPEVSPVPEVPPGPNGSPAPKEGPGPEEAPAAAAGATTHVTGQPEAAADLAMDLAIDTEPGQDDPASDEGTPWTREQQPAGAGHRHNGGSTSAFSPAPVMLPVEADAGERGAETEPEPEAQAGPEPEAQAEPEPTAQAKPEPTAQAGPEPEAGTSPGPEAKTKSEPEAKAGPEPEAKTRPEPEAEPDLRGEPKPETGPGAETQPQADAGAGPATGTGPGTGAQPEANPAPASAATAQFARRRSSPVPPDA